MSPAREAFLTVAAAMAAGVVVGIQICGKQYVDAALFGAMSGGLVFKFAYLDLKNATQSTWRERAIDE